MLENKAIKLVTEANELMNFCVKQTSACDIKGMDADNFAAIQKCISLVDSACELMVEEAQMMDDMDRKLDNVLYLLRNMVEESYRALPLLFLFCMV